MLICLSMLSKQHIGVLLTGTRRDIYGHRVGGKQSFHKDPFFYTKGVNNVPSLIVANDEDHSRMRKVLSHAFSDKALKEQEPLFQEWANVMVNKMREKADDPSQKLNLVSYLNFTTSVTHAHPD